MGNQGARARSSKGRWARASVGVAMAVGLGSCAGTGETPLSRAKVGDALVRSDRATVRLARVFRTAEPNALLDGAVRVRTQAGEQLQELNAVCSLPDSPGWPAYDNLFGRPIRDPEQAKGTTGTTSWQVLFPFAGGEKVNMGKSPGAWLARLRDNLCRRGDFDDRPTGIRRGRP